MEVIRGHLGCPLSGGCPLFGGSAIGGSTVYLIIIHIVLDAHVHNSRVKVLRSLKNYISRTKLF